ncbi:MAG: hypothetical protein QXF12_04185 [Candidatus Aenigmatarchaeota archaeon]
MNYTVRYVKEYPSRKIYNYLGPWDWRDDEERKERRKYLYYENKEWYDRLEENILKNGILNPILVVCGQIAKNDWCCLPEFVKKEPIICYFLGGSRLFIAQKHNLMIPCLVSDFLGKFSDYPSLYHGYEIREKFSNPPKNIKFTKYGLDTR